MFSSSAYARVAWIATVLAFIVISFGAFVRLSNAGLSCPDWPTCYGQIAWPTQQHEITTANAAFPERPVEPSKAWREQMHRMLAGGLIVATFTLAIWAWRSRRRIHLSPRLSLIAAGLIVFQALLGMWTVTWKLKPIVVMGHLLAGVTTFGLLAYIALCSSRLIPLRLNDNGKLQRLIIVGLFLLAGQIALGGWTSANYAALACGNDFPTCQGQWWPTTDFHEAFILWRGIGVNYEGGVLDAAARTAIQLSHRIGAVLVFGHLSTLIIISLRRRLYGFGLTLGGLLILQITLGISNVVFGLPLPIATAHNAVAALLIFTLLVVLARLRVLRDGEG